MKKNLKNFLGIIIITCFLILPFLVFAQDEGEAGDAASGQQPTTEVITTTSHSGGSSLDTLSRIGGKAGYTDVKLHVAAGTIVNGALSILGIIFIVIIVIGGFKWLTAGGDEAQVTKALAYIKRAIIGLIITLSAAAIWLFIVTRLT